MVVMHKNKKEEGSETLELLLILAAAAVMLSAIVFSGEGVKDTGKRGNTTVTQSQDSYLENWENDDEYDE